MPAASGCSRIIRWTTDVPLLCNPPIKRKRRVDRSTSWRSSLISWGKGWRYIPSRYSSGFLRRLRRVQNDAPGFVIRQLTLSDAHCRACVPFPDAANTICHNDMAIPSEILMLSGTRRAQFICSAPGLQRPVCARPVSQEFRRIYFPKDPRAHHPEIGPHTRDRPHTDSSARELPFVMPGHPY